MHTWAHKRNKKYIFNCISTSGKRGSQLVCCAMLISQLSLNALSSQCSVSNAIPTYLYWLTAKVHEELQSSVTMMFVPFGIAAKGITQRSHNNSEGDLHWMLSLPFAHEPFLLQLFVVVWETRRYRQTHFTKWLQLSTESCRQLGRPGSNFRMMLTQLKINDSNQIFI